MGRLVWNAWARTMVLSGMFCGAFSAIPLAFYQIPGETLGYYHSIYFGVIIVLFLPLYWPLEFLGRVRIIIQFWWVNAVIWAGLCVFPFFKLPGFFIGLSWAFAAIFYVIAGIRKEQSETLETLAGKPRGE